MYLILLIFIDFWIAADSTQPNIIFMLADDTGWNGVGWHNDNACRQDPQCAILTPHMDKLVAGGLQLDRHYTFVFCSPTRSAFLSGRLPIHVNQENKAEWPWTAAPIHPNMTTLPEKLASRGYQTHHIGKWHLGLAKQSFTPVGRGFNSSLAYLSGSEMHFTHAKGAVQCHSGKYNCTGHCSTDLWDGSKPALGHDGIYSVDVYGQRAVDIIHHAAANDGAPFFIYLAWSNTHEPLEVPTKYLERYPSSMKPPEKRTLRAMVSAMDDAVANISDALHETGLWNSTLLVWAADNGGPTGSGTSPPHSAQCAANNYPLRGGKGDDFEGGVRTAGFVTGGILPLSMRGKVASDYVHVVDWLATFIRLAGGDPQDLEGEAKGMPPVDSLDVWPYLSGSSPSSPRQELPLSIREGGKQAGLISGKFKLVMGNQHGAGLHWYPTYPANTSRPPNDDPGCPDGCLFLIKDDPLELTDVKDKYSQKFQQMHERLIQLSSTLFQSDEQIDNHGSYDCKGALTAARGKWKNYAGRPWFGPWLP